LILKRAGVMERELDQVKIRQQALSALEKSTKLFQVAENLLRQGNSSEAEWVKNEARAQRNISVWLMAQANRPKANEKRESRHSDSYRPVSAAERGARNHRHQ